MDYIFPKSHQGSGGYVSSADSTAAVVAAILDYSGVLDRVGGNMGLGMNAAASSFVTLMLWNILAKDKFGYKPPSGSGKLFKPVTGAVYSGLAAMILNRILGNNIQNPNLLGALGTLLGTYGAASHEYSNPSG